MNGAEEIEGYSREEFKRDMKRMLDSIRKEGASATSHDICEGAECLACPLSIICDNDSNLQYCMWTRSCQLAPKYQK